MQHGTEEFNKLYKALSQISVMYEKSCEVNPIRGGFMAYRLVCDLNRIANSGWLNLYEQLADKGVDVDKLFLEKESDTSESGVTKKLTLKSMNETPVYEGDCHQELLLYSSCDGFHIAYAHFNPDTNTFKRFTDFTYSNTYDPSHYVGWAFLPELNNEDVSLLKGGAA